MILLCDVFSTVHGTTTLLMSGSQRGSESTWRLTAICAICWNVTFNQGLVCQLSPVVGVSPSLTSQMTCVPVFICILKHENDDMMTWHHVIRQPKRSIKYQNSYHTRVNNLSSPRPRPLQQSQDNPQGTGESTACKVCQQIQWSVRLLSTAAQTRQKACERNNDGKEKAMTITQ